MILTIFYSLWFCIEMIVTTMDSASKALKFLGLVEDVASEVHGVKFSNRLF